MNSSVQKTLIVKTLGIILLTAMTLGCQKNATETTEPQESVKEETPFVWKGANLYFLLTDRFSNGDASNDLNFDRTDSTATLRGFKGGDIKGITQKIKEGYFSDLGVNAIWFTPVVEQVHGGTDEGTGFTYAFHGYWTKDWTALDPNFGTMEDLAELVSTAHAHGIRIVMDAVINHTGPVTEKDPQWPDAWVRTEPKCEYNSYETAVRCTLVDNLPDIKTESDDDVDLPEQLVQKWRAEGRYEKEIAELDEFFAQTGYPRAPKYYIIKWLTDYIRDFGIDGFRADTVRHIEEGVWAAFKNECEKAFEQWKNDNPDQVLDDNEFYTVGEVYDYDIISTGQYFDFGDVKVNYYENGFDSMINFEFKKSANEDYETLFSSYSSAVNEKDSGIQVLNYLTSHDDGTPFDKERKRSMETATKLLLSPGTSQIYYGDESARTLIVEGTEGDATLRSEMNWKDIQNKEETKALLAHWQKLGKFRRDHPAVGAGLHRRITEAPYVFMRTYVSADLDDKVVIGLDLNKGSKVLAVGDAFEDGAELRDAYSDTRTKVKNGEVTLDTPFNIVMLEGI